MKPKRPAAKRPGTKPAQPARPPLAVVPEPEQAPAEPEPEQLPEWLQDRQPDPELHRPT